MSGTTRFLIPAAPRELQPRAASPTFSVVIPAYQAAQTVAAAVSSALAQSYAPLEVIVVDDGSTDDLDGALAQFGGDLRVLRKPNGGHASALNAGAEAASGEFFAILDADDTYEPRRLAALAELVAARPDLDLITTDARFVVDGREVGSFCEFNPFEVEDQRSAILRSCFVGGWPAVRLTTLRSVGLFDESLLNGCDWDCWLRLIFAGVRAGLVDEPYYRYRISAGSLSANRVPALWARVRLLEKARADQELTRREQRTLARSLRHHRTRAVLAETEATLAEGRPNRAQSLRRALEGGISPRARLATGLAATLPGAARRIVPQDRPPEKRFAA